MSSRDAYDESSYHSSEWSDIEDDESSEDSDETYHYYESLEDDDEYSYDEEIEEEWVLPAEDYRLFAAVMSAEDRLFDAVASDDADAASSDEQSSSEDDEEYYDEEVSEEEDALSAEDRLVNAVASDDAFDESSYHSSEWSDIEDEDEESSEEEQALSQAEDRRLFAAVMSDDADAAAEAVQQAIRDGANVNAVRYDSIVEWGATPLTEASERGNAQIIRILLDAGADARWRDSYGSSAIMAACMNGHLSTVQLLINHDNSLLEIVDDDGRTPLLDASDSDIVRFLLDSGADPHHVDKSGHTALMYACDTTGSLESVRLLLGAGVDVEARDEEQQSALHYAALGNSVEIMLELIRQHNANIFAVDRDGDTPFDLAYAAVNPLLEMYGNKLTQDHGRLALHELFKVAEYSFAEEEDFHPPLNPLRIILPLGKLTLLHLRTLLHSLDPELELIRNRDDTGKLPLHIACQTNAPMEVLALILELDPTTLHIADSTGALPIHLLLCGTSAATEYASVRYMVEQGGVGTLAARNRQGLLPLHVLSGSTNPPLRVVQYLIQSFRGSVAVQTNAGQYPFFIAAAADSSSASLSVIYELVRANPGLVIPR